MTITTYKVTDNITLLDVFFLKEDILYASESYFEYGREKLRRKVFDANKVFLGTIVADKFPKHQLEEVK